MYRHIYIYVFPLFLKYSTKSFLLDYISSASGYYKVTQGT